jgi:hypothetical protein
MSKVARRLAEMWRRAKSYVVGIDFSPLERLKILLTEAAER